MDKEANGLRPPTRKATLHDIMNRLMTVTTDEEGRSSTQFAPLWEWELIVSGAAAALERYRAAAQGGEGIEARASVGEALWWFACADEYLQKRVSYELNQPDYYTGLAKTRSGRLLGSLSFLRNRAGHQVAQVLAQGSSVNLPYAIDQPNGRVLGEVVVTVSKLADPHDLPPGTKLKFAPFEKLPAADPKFSERLARDQWYAKLVAGRDVEDVLDEALAAVRETIRVDRTDGHVNLTLGWCLSN